MKLFRKQYDGSKKLDWFQIVPIVIGVFYILGFLIWNIYLSLFGFFEYNFLQTRFLSAGIAASFCVVVPLVLCYQLADLLLEKISRLIIKWKFLLKIQEFIRISIFVLISFFAISAYTFFLFPLIPQFLGGARPVIVSLLGEGDRMEYLNNFNIYSAPNADSKKSVQTLPICALYQNNDYILLGVQYAQNGKPFNRNILLKMDQIEGLQYGLGEDYVRCKPLDFFVGTQEHKGTKIYDPAAHQGVDMICK